MSSRPFPLNTGANRSPWRFTRASTLTVAGALSVPGCRGIAATSTLAGCCRITTAALEPAPKALINNAAAQTFRPVEDFTTEEFARILYVNTIAPFALSRAVLPAMIAAGGGLIVNVASDLSYRPHVNGAAYCSPVLLAR